MIVKNEEMYLEECLLSVKDLVDEIIIVDTGSTDKTIPIAESFGASVYHHKWNNDFSEARNYSLSKVTSDWILYLDADERLDASSRQLLKRLTSNKDKIGYRCKIYNVDEINKKPKLQRYTRLFRNIKGIRFSGKAHEQIDDSLFAHGYKIQNCELLINHYGYNIDKDGLKHKAKRNLDLLLLDYQNKSSGYCAFQIANSYNILNDITNTFNYHSLAVKDDSLPNEYKSISYSSIADYYQQNNNLGEALTNINNSIKCNPENIIANLTASEVYSKMGKNIEAVSFCISAFEINNAQRSSKSTSKLLDIYVDEEKILYHGLHISYKLNDQTGIEYFFNHLEDYRSNQKQFWNKELHIIQMFTSNSILTFEDIQLVEEIITDNSFNFYFQLLEFYSQIDSKILIEKKLLEKFPDNIKLYNRYAADLNSEGNIDQAIRFLEEATKKFSAEASMIIYLISLYLQNKEFDKLDQFIRRTKEKNSQNKKLIEHINTIEHKIYSAINKN